MAEGVTQEALRRVFEEASEYTVLPDAFLMRPADYRRVLGWHLAGLGVTGVSWRRGTRRSRLRRWRRVFADKKARIKGKGGLDAQ